MRTKASWTSAKKLAASFSNRVANRRHSLRWFISLSITLRSLYVCSLNLWCGPFWRLFRPLGSFFSGINALIPLLRKYWRQGFPVYALSATTSFGRVRKPEEVGIKMLSIALGNCVASCLFPPVSTALKGFPKRSQTTWILQVKPPRERPNACSPAFF